MNSPGLLPQTGTHQRSVPRRPMSVPVDVTVLRSGVPVGIPGRAVDVGEGGLGAVLAAELLPGQVVGVKFQLPQLGMFINAQARVRYEKRLRCGLQFVGLRPEQQAMIRYWIGVAGEKPPAPPARPAQKPVESPRVSAPSADRPLPDRRATPSKPEVKVPAFLLDTEKESRGRERWMQALVVLALLSTATAAFGWWRWQQGWEELESHLRAHSAAASTKMQVKVPPDVMQKFLVHKVQPVYPEEALHSRLRGTVLLDTVIGEDGEVVSLKPLSGPDVLSRAAAESLRWWRFEPYKVDGRPVSVETTLAVEFQ
jgi:TonB family protein